MEVEADMAGTEDMVGGVGEEEVVVVGDMTVGEAVEVMDGAATEVVEAVEVRPCFDKHSSPQVASTNLTLVFSLCDVTDVNKLLHSSLTKYVVVRYVFVT